MKTFHCLLGFIVALQLQAQPLHPGFDINEYIELMRISVVSSKADEYIALHEKPRRFKMIYQSGTVGLQNSWDLWVDGKGYAVVSIRGTTTHKDSWLENFYSALIPAIGEITLNEAGEKFAYELAPDPRAGVHAGWMVATAFLAKEIVPKLDSLYYADIGEIFIVGHSQGGGIAYLLMAHLKNLQATGQLHPDMRIKMYGSASPKPGNYFFATHFEAITQNGWAYNVVNSADWVPQVPFSIQTLDDFNTTNPFKNAEAIINEQKFTDRVVLRHVFKKLDGPTRKAQQNYQKYLGDMTTKMVVQRIPGLVLPSFLPSNDYVRTGNIKILTPDSIYFQEFPDDSENIFNHHLHQQYVGLAKRTDFGQPIKPETAAEPGVSLLRLHDIWVLESFNGEVIKTEGRRSPYIELKVRAETFMGNGGCNQIFGKVKIDDKTITFSDIGATRMFCGDDNIEPRFLEILKNTFSWSLADGRLRLTQGRNEVFVFKKVD